MSVKRGPARTHHRIFRNYLFKMGLLASAGATGLIAGSGALAQQTPAPAPSSQIETITVSASRQGNENIQSVPMAISAINPAELENFGLSGLEDYTRMVPSLTLQELGPGINKIDIRGVNTSGIDYTDVQDRPLVAQYLDDTPISLQAQNPDLKVYDLERVEVLRGPQGTLYGEGAMAGTIRLITKQPDSTAYSGSAETTLSDTDSGSGGFNYSLRGMLNIPLVEDKLALRVNAYRGDNAGFIENLGQGRTDNGDQTNQARIALRYTATPDLTIDASFTYAGLRAGVNDGFSGLGEYQFTSLEPETTTDDLKIYNTTVNYNLGFANLTSATSYLERHDTFTSANEYGVNAFLFGGPPIDSASDIVRNRVKNLVEETRLTSQNSGDLKWTVGIFYENLTRNYWQDQPAANFDERWGPIVGVPDYNSTLDGAFHANDDFSGFQDSTETQTAYFGQVTYTVFDKLDLTAGLRYFDWRQSFNLYFGGVFGASPVTTAVSQGVPLNETGDASAKGATPRFAAAYHIDDDTMVFAEAAKGFRYGGVNQPVPISICGPYLSALGLQQAPLTFGPDKLWSYSLGEKASLLDKRLQLNLTGFLIDWSDVQTTRDLACSYYFIENKGKIQSKGLEIEATGKPIPALLISANGSYTDAETDGSIPNLNAPSGSQTTYSPRFIASLSGQYNIPFADDNLALGVNYTYRSTQNTTFNPDDTNFRQIPSSNVVNLQATYSHDNMEIGVFANNLTNGDKIINVQAAVPGSAAPGDTIFYARPRTIGLRLRVDF